MNLDLITFISEYYQLKMDSIHEPLEMLRNLSQTHNDEVLMASMAYRSQIIDLDTAFFEKAITATNFNLDEILKKSEWFREHYETAFNLYRIANRGGSSKVLR
jgi:hypothetical protein